MVLNTCNSGPGRPANLDDNREREYCIYSWCKWGSLDTFFLVGYFYFQSPSLWETVRYRLNY